jgi:hypothetical protein
MMVCWKSLVKGKENVRVQKIQDTLQESGDFYPSPIPPLRLNHAMKHLICSVMKPATHGINDRSTVLPELAHVRLFPG